MKHSLPQVVNLGRDECANLEFAEQHEWWLANGKGGYAGGTVAGTLTRRYHGLLIEARIWMDHGKHSTGLAWRLLENPEAREVYLRVMAPSSRRVSASRWRSTHCGQG